MQQQIGLGKLQLPITKKQFFTVYGGPYFEKPPMIPGVKMAAEIRKVCAISIPTEDFQVPDTGMLDYGLEEAVIRILRGEPLYVGCMGGKGRTGIFLSILAKAFGIPSPIEYVRLNYNKRAVETNAQYKFVTLYEIPEVVKQRIERAKWKAYLRFWKKDLTRPVDTLDAEEVQEDSRVF